MIPLPSLRSFLLATVVLAWPFSLASAVLAQSGGFEGPTTIPLGGTAIDLRCADLDGDALPDMVVCDLTRNLVQVLLNDGHGSYGPPATHVMPEWPMAAAIADLDGDLDADVAVVSYFGGTVTLLLNQGAGTFVPNTPIPIAPRPGGVVGGDIDMDGDADLVVTHSGSGGQSGLSVLRNLGGGTFAPPTTSHAANLTDPKLLDMDFDGDLDVVTTNSAVMMILRNNGLGIFTTQGVPAGPPSIREFGVADLDGDIDLDFVVASSDQYVRVVLNLGGGSFGAPVTQFHLLTEASGMSTGDLDGDGDHDVGVTNESGSYVLRSVGGGALSILSTLQSGLESNAMAMTDCDADGDLDLAVASSGDFQVMTDLSAVSIHWNAGDATFPIPTSSTTPYAPSAIAAGDLEGDGDQDVVVAIQTFGSISVYANHDDGTWGPQVSYDTYSNPTSVALADFDADGDVDVVTTSYGPSTTGSAQVRLNQGLGTFGDAVSNPLVALPLDIAVGDLDRDGDLDLALSNSVANVSVLLNNGNATFTAAVWYATGGNGSSVAIGDLDGDTYPDLAVTNGQSNDISVLRNLGNGTFAPHVRHPAGVDPAGIVIAHLDSDGDLDIAVLNRGGAGISVLMNLGGMSFAPQAVVPTGVFPMGLTAGDFDVDGDVDLAITNYAYVERGIWVLWNAGDGTFPTREEVATPSRPSGIMAFDMEGDGDLDLADINVQLLSWTSHRNGASSGRVVCAGDGSGAACPCGNSSAPGSGAGCLHSFGQAGTLRAGGSASLAHDAVVLRGTDMPATSTALYFQGTSTAGAGSGVAFGDGLRCAAGTVVRLGIRTNAGGASQVPVAGQLPLSQLGAVTTSGERVYQAWYRNLAPFCTASGFNLTNGVLIRWAP